MEPTGLTRRLLKAIAPQTFWLANESTPTRPAAHARAVMKNLRTYGKAPLTSAVIHGGPGAAGEMAPVARETATSLEGQIDELKMVLEENGDLLSRYQSLSAYIFQKSLECRFDLRVCVSHPAGLFIIRQHGESLALAVVLPIKARHEFVTIKHGQDIITPAALMGGFVDLPGVLEVPKLLHGLTALDHWSSGGAWVWNCSATRHEEQPILALTPVPNTVILSV